MSAQRTALLIGASGLVGARCLEHLLASDRYAKVTCLVRRATGHAAHPRLEERVVDFDALGALEPVDDVFCAIGTTMKKAGSREAFRKVDFELPLAVAERAKGAGAARMVLVSSVGADAGASSFYLRTKGELEDALAKLDFRALHVLRPSFLVGERSESRPGEAVGIAVARGVGALLFGGMRKYRAIDADVVARAMVAAAQRNDEGTKVYHHDEIIALGRPG